MKYLPSLAVLSVVAFGLAPAQSQPAANTIAGQAVATMDGQSVSCSGAQVTLARHEPLQKEYPMDKPIVLPMPRAFGPADVVATATCDADGHFQFSNVADGTYEVGFIFKQGAGQKYSASVIAVEGGTTQHVVLN